MLSFLSFFLLSAFATTELKPVSEFNLPGDFIKVNHDNMIITPEDYLKLTPGSYEQLTVKKMSFNEKIMLAIGKKSLKKITIRAEMQNCVRVYLGGFNGIEVALLSDFSSAFLGRLWHYSLMMITSGIDSGRHYIQLFGWLS